MKEATGGIRSQVQRANICHAEHAIVEQVDLEHGQTGHTTGLSTSRSNSRELHGREKVPSKNILLGFFLTKLSTMFHYIYFTFYLF